MSFPKLIVAATVFAFAGSAASLAPAQGGSPVAKAPPVAAPATKPAPKPFAPARFSVEVVGSGPDVILIPGLTASREVWRGTVAAAPGYRYHLVQVAGFAGTAPRANAQGAVVAPLADEIARYIQAKGLQRPAIVGHSMGGTVAMMIAARHSSRAGKVMVVDMLPEPAGLVGSSASGARGLAGALRGLSGSEGGRRLIQSAIRIFGNAEAQESESDPDVVARATEELAGLDLTPELPKIQAPLTVVYASADVNRRATADQAYKSAYAPAKGAKLVRIDGSGHMIMYDQPGKFSAALRSFLRE
jgi:pimeloyl-ACP methyl ester carboxylesterase